MGSGITLFKGIACPNVMRDAGNLPDSLISIVVGVLELAALAIVTGCLVTLAALSHIVEWLFVIVNPTINFFLHQVNELILSLIVLMARLTSNVVAGMFPCQETDPSSCLPIINELDFKDTDEGISFPDGLQDFEELQDENDD